MEKVEILNDQQQQQSDCQPAVANSVASYEATATATSNGVRKPRKVHNDSAEETQHVEASSAGNETGTGTGLGTKKSNNFRKGKQYAKSKFPTGNGSNTNNYERYNLSKVRKLIRNLQKKY